MSDLVTSTPLESATPSATPSVTPSAQATSSAPVSTPTTGVPSTPSVPEGYVPSYRLRETREAAQREFQSQLASARAEAKAEVDKLRSQVHSLVGVNPPANPEVEGVRAQFARLYPGLARMEERANDVFGLVDKAGDLEQSTAHYWQSYGRQAMDKLYGHAAESLGAPLTEEGKRQLHAAFTGWVGSSPELSERYASDPTIVEDFWKNFTASFVDPVRRTAQAGVVGRASGAIPQDAPAGAPRMSPPPAPPSSLDERAARSWAMFNELKNK